jgi:Ca2+-binding EF-hand superfamily protein
MLLLAAVMATPAAVPEAPHRHAGRPFISPMGEPFAVRTSGDDTLADWFNQADRNHDGALTANEMQADADRFFAVLDTNHDGEIDPDEVTHYEDVIAPETPELGRVAGGTSQEARAAAQESGSGRHSRGRWDKSRGHLGLGDSDPEGQGRARFGLLDLPEPVVAADSDFNRGVSLAEFRKAALQRFQALDVNSQGRLTLAVLETLKPAPPARPAKDPDAPPLDVDPDTSGD